MVSFLQPIARYRNIAKRQFNILVYNLFLCMQVRIFTVTVDWLEETFLRLTLYITFALIIHIMANDIAISGRLEPLSSII